MGQESYSLSGAAFKTFTNVTFPITYNQIFSVSTLSMIAPIGTKTVNGATLIPAVECISLAGTVIWGVKNNGSASSKCNTQTLMVIGC